MAEKNKQPILNEFHIPRWEELPSVALYLDQVVTLVNSSLAPILSLNYSSSKKENAILTKTMINNYVKNNLIESPEKKKYGKNQLAKLFVICILKQVYSMNDINALINIALASADIQVSYNQYCFQFEEALKCTYYQKDFTVDTSNNKNRYLLKSVLLSCAYKIYTTNMIQNTNWSQEHKDTLK